MTADKPSPRPFCRNCGRVLRHGSRCVICYPKKPGSKPAPKIVDTDTIKPLTPPPSPPPPMKLAQRYCDCGAPIGNGNHAGICFACRTERPTYLPTPEEIAEACAEIQADWSRQEAIRRRTGNIEE